MITKIFSQDIMINNCPACGSIDLEIFRTLNSFPAILFPIEKEKWNTVSASPIQSSVCNECGHIFLNQIDKLFSDNIYKNYYYLYPYKGLESMRSAYRESFEKVAGIYLSKKNKSTLLEIGCESVDQMKLFVDFGCLCTAINPGAKPNDKVKFINGFYGTDKINKKFDYIISRFNLEHIIDCKVFFSNLKENLKSNGIIMVQVPNIEFFFSLGILNIFAHEHPHYFCKSSLLAMINRYGFEMLYISKSDEPSLICVFALPIDRNHYKPQQALSATLKVISNLKELINNAPDNVILYGAGLSLAALIYDEYVDQKLMSKIHLVDDNPILSGRYMPNTKLKVILSSEMVVRPDTIIILMLSAQYHAVLLPRLKAKYSKNLIYVIVKEGLIKVNGI